MCSSFWVVGEFEVGQPLLAPSEQLQKEKSEMRGIKSIFGGWVWGRRGGESSKIFPTGSACILSWHLGEENGKITASTGTLEYMASFSRADKPLVLMEFGVCSARWEFWVVTILNAELETQISTLCIKIYGVFFPESWYLFTLMSRGNGLKVTPRQVQVGF